jgi:hypothetical protein
LLGLGALLSLSPLPRQGREPLRFLAAVLAWCVLLLLLTRRHPFERVWLFLLPVYLTASAAGWAALLRGLPERWTVLKHRAVLPVASVALAALFGWQVLATESVLRSPETGLFVEAEPVAEFLAARYRERGRILIYAGDAPASEPFTYYWRRQGLQQQVQDASPLQRVFVLVADGDERRAAAILAREGMPPEGFSPLAVAFRVGQAAVFVSHPEL